LRDFIPVCEPFLNGKEIEYVTDAVSSGWISSSGKYVEAFEKAFAAYCGARYGTAVCNGTVALHLMLVAAGIGAGDEVIIPSFTMASTAFAVCYTGAMPVFVDAERHTWNIDVELVPARISPRTKAIMPVHIFGNPCDSRQVRALAAARGILVLDDAAEAHGAEINGIRAGRLADMSAFSFFANKNITTGEGGMVVTDRRDFWDRLRYYRNVCFPLDAPRVYEHRDIGFNYRMSNLHAAVGLAQVERGDFYRDRRIANHRLYRKFLDRTSGLVFQQELASAQHVHWMNGVVVQPEVFGKSRDELVAFLQRSGIETRLFFTGMHRQESLKKHGCNCSGSYPVTDWLTENGFYLPSGSNLQEEEIAFICKKVVECRGA
jgi:perosamine synthetase